MKIKFEELIQGLKDRHRSIEHIFSNCKCCGHPLKFYIGKLPNKVINFETFEAKCPNQDFHILFFRNDFEVETGAISQGKYVYIYEKHKPANTTSLLKLTPELISGLATNYSPYQKIYSNLGFIKLFYTIRASYPNKISTINQLVDLPISSFKDRQKLDRLLMLFP